MSLIGHGVENSADGIHGDDRYVYVIESPREEFGEVGEWSVKMSEHCGFPRWDVPTTAAFERATWQFKGTITGAIEALVVEVSGP